MIRRYKDYTVVDSNGLKKLLDNSGVENNQDLYRFFDEHNILVVNKKQKINDSDFKFMKSVTYNDFLEKNKEVKKRACQLIHIIEIYGSKILSDCKTIFEPDGEISRFDIDYVIESVYSGISYVTNPHKLKDFIGFNNK